MRILVVGGLVPWHPEAGGGQIVAYELGEALSRAGPSVDYLAIAPKEHRREVGWGNFIYFAQRPSVVSSFQAALQSAKSGGLDKYDIVYVHTGYAAGHCLAYALRRRMTSEPRFALTVHSPKVYAFPRSPAEIVWAISSRSADLILSVSEFSKRNICRAWRIASSKVAVMYAGADSSFLAQTQTRKKSTGGRLSLLFCGRLNGPREQKGVDVLLRSMSLVERHHGVLLDIIGTGAKLERYRALAHELNIGDRVNFLGFIEHERLPSYYAQADLFVLPSRKESFGLVLAEAMACGVPVVSTTVGAIPEVVNDGVTGLLVPPDDPQALADAINTLLSDPERRRAMGIAGRERVEKYFTWDKVAKRVLEGYYSIL